MLQTGSLELDITTPTLNELTFKDPMERNKQTKIHTKQNILEINSLSVRNANSWGKKNAFF
jgi:hypothetical protein